MERKQIREFVKNNFSQMTDQQMADRCGVTAETIRHIRRAMKLRKTVNSQNRQLVDNPPVEQKSGMEVRGDHIVINWTTKTIITELGEFGQFICSFDMHKAIQRAYVNGYDGKGSTAAEIAMKFDFQHAKAVLLYAKHHGFTKSSVPQTDIEFELGLTPEEAVKENIQAMKRKTYKETERAKWQLIQNAADKWFNFHHNVLKPFENHIEEFLPKYKPNKVSIKKISRTGHAHIIGISDVHYMKQCFDHNGTEIYNREIALSKLQEHAEAMIAEIVARGIPEKIIIPIGNDNIHVDGQTHMTTAGTPQAAQTQGSWKIELGKYVDMTIGMIDMFAQVAPVEVVTLFGNHDKHTCFLLQVFLERLYRGRDDVSIRVNQTSRTYMSFGTTGVLFTHGDDMSLAKMEKKAHMLIMSEAKQQGIDVGKIDRWLVVCGHLHHDYTKDLGGNTKIVVMPSFTPPDEWHQVSGFVGTQEESTLYTIDAERGLIATSYVQ